MNKILILCTIIGMMAGVPAYSATREGALNTNSRSTNTATARSTATPRQTTQNSQSNTRATRNTATRAGTLKIDTAPRTNANVRPRSNSSATPARRTVQIVRATTSTSNLPSEEILETRTGAAYARCKSAYFQCMDQFCQLKNDDYRRCSCSQRIHDLANIRQNIIDTNTKLTEFTENLDAVGMTAAQATAIHTASDGENALTADTSASKALLTAIMNSIRGGDTTVGGKMSDLNSINISFDTVNMFGLSDTAQVIASYNGTELYNAVYPSCRGAVADDCNNASLQRAVTAYLMAIEQDCNTVQTALENKQKDLRAAIREGSALLDLARIENRNKHNSDNLATCIANVESAILSEEVCGANYHKCLDNGEFIDVTTGAPITGVVHFYELENLLKFDYGKDAVDQKLAQNPGNRNFVTNFENKTKKFATDALDKCTEIADTAWAEYLDKALLDIYYAQKAKVQTIRTGCFDLISKCYENRETAITAAMAELIDGTSEISLLPDKIILTRQMCSNYVDSCNNMFTDENGEHTIIADYVEHQSHTDTTAACRAVVQQCFDSFGGANYENFYYPNSGTFETGVVDGLKSEYPNKKLSALDWFSLYEYDEYGQRKPGYKSKCADRVSKIPSCADKVEQVFGGLDAIEAKRGTDAYGQYIYEKRTTPDSLAYGYGWAKLDDGLTDIPWEDQIYKFKNRRLRPTGVATEVYNQIIDTLATQCMNSQGKFIEAQFIDHTRYGANPYDNDNLCKLAPLINLESPTATTEILYGMPMGKCKSGSTNLGGAARCDSTQGQFSYQSTDYKLYRENICPRGYISNTDYNAWGICSCWDNGGRRSLNGLSAKCENVIQVFDEDTNQLFEQFEACSFELENESHNIIGYNLKTHPSSNINWATHVYLHTILAGDPYRYWCTSTINTKTNQVCPLNHQGSDCEEYIKEYLPDLPEGI